jgi:phosphate starvation-inducible PhoH-like protein
MIQSPQPESAKIPNQPHHFTPQPLDNRLLINSGALDENLRQISAALDVTIFRRGDRFVVTGTNAERAVEVLERFYEKADRPVAVDDIQLALASSAPTPPPMKKPACRRCRRAVASRCGRPAAAAAADDKDSQDPLPESPILKTRKHDLRGRTPHQSQYPTPSWNTTSPSASARPVPARPTWPWPARSMRWSAMPCSASC